MQTLLLKGFLMHAARTLFFLLPWMAIPANAATVTIRVSDGQQALPCRIHLQGPAGEYVRVAGLPFWRDHFSCDGEVKLELVDGRYTYSVHRSPEYESRQGEIRVEGGQAIELPIVLPRIYNLREHGWYAADLHVHRRYQDVPLLMRAADLDFAPVITWWNKRSDWSKGGLPENVLQQFDGHRLMHVMAGEDERGGGALLYFGMRRPMDITQAKYEATSPMTYVQQALQQEPNVWIDIEKPFWWDVPTWVASGKMKSIGLANNHMLHDGMYENEAWGYPRDVNRMPAPKGNGYWTQEIYYQILNSGIRIPPSAGSASGVLKNPVGYNRVYVHLDEPLSHASWWQGLERGACFVTNGPQVICKANGGYPGTELSGPAGKELQVRLEIELVSDEPIAELVVIGNGDVVQQIPHDPRAKRQTLSTEFSVKQSGWFLVRAIAENDKTFRFGSTGPFYVRLGAEANVVRAASVGFFQNWLDQRIERLGEAVEDPAERRQVLETHLEAKKFWQAKAAAAVGEPQSGL